MTLEEFDNSYLEKGFAALCGVDEAGRGPLAGPVYAAAVILPPGLVIEKLGDSKQLGERRRERLYNIIVEQAVACSVAAATVEEIDEINILSASMLAMQRAVEWLDKKPDCILVDGNTLPRTGHPFVPVVKGDAKSASIAAASILAKVERDRYMRLLDLEYPQYSFARHKGYPTRLHYEMLDLHGPCPAHRQTFLRKWRMRQR